MASSSSPLPSFDPRHVPVTGVDDHLPAVPSDRLTPQAMRQRFETPPAWQPEVRREPRFADRPAATAAVLVPLVQRPAGLSVLLTERSANLSTHSGQVAFPGGRKDAEDPDVVHTALRETHEEVGLPRHYVDVLGQLPVYVTGTRFIVTPVVGLVREGFQLKPNADEVAHAFEVPLAYLMNPAHHRRHRFEWDGQVREWFSMPYQETAPLMPTPQGMDSERFIWGATAGMLRNLYRFLLA